MNQQIYEKDIENLNIDSLEAGAKLRLYSDDKIIKLYSELAKFKKYCFSKERLGEEFKISYMKELDELSKMMKSDLNIDRKNQKSS